MPSSATRFRVLLILVVPLAIIAVLVIGATTAVAPSASLTSSWDVPFLSRPASGPIALKGCRDVVIENHTFQDLGPDVEAIHLERCHGVTIRANDFRRVAQAITAVNSSDIRVEWNRYEDILGPHERVGLHRANFVQFDKVSGGYIGHNKGRGGDTEDIVSLHNSGGTPEAPLYVEDNHFEGTNWTSPSGSGIALGDGGSAHSIARDNTLLNVGQVGIFIAGGTSNAILDNIVYGEARPSSNVGVYVWNQSGGTCSGHEVRGNRVEWFAADGQHNASWDAGNCGPIAGWNSNTWDAPLDPDTLHVEL